MVSHFPKFCWLRQWQAWRRLTIHKSGLPTLFMQRQNRALGVWRKASSLDILRLMTQLPHPIWLRQHHVRSHRIWVLTYLTFFVCVRLVQSFCIIMSWPSWDRRNFAQESPTRCFPSACSTHSCFRWSYCPWQALHGAVQSTKRESWYQQTCDMLLVSWSNPCHPCMVYSPTFSWLFWYNMVNVGKIVWVILFERGSSIQSSRIASWIFGSSKLVDGRFVEACRWSLFG